MTALTEQLSLGSEIAPSLWASVFITDELWRRKDCVRDHEQEKVAITQIFQGLVRDPDSMLPKLVELALSLCGAQSGGISLEETSKGHFRWHYLRGELAPFDGGTTPRNHSPCGVVLDTKSVALLQRPERVYSWLELPSLNACSFLFT